jgi:hypothetical protein
VVSSGAYNSACFEECPYAVWIGKHGWLSHGVVRPNRLPFFPVARSGPTTAKRAGRLPDVSVDQIDACSACLLQLKDIGQHLTGPWNGIVRRFLLQSPRVQCAWCVKVFSRS